MIGMAKQPWSKWPGRALAACLVLALEVAGFAAPAPVSAQEAPVLEGPDATSAPPAAGTEIVVRGEEPQAVDNDAFGVNFAKQSRGLAAESAYFVRCARLPEDLDRLRAIVDNGPAALAAEYALHDFVVRNRGCFQGYPTLPPYPQTPYYGQCNQQLGTGMCRNTFDRAALYEATIRKYARNFELTSERTFDAEVRARFTARQALRNHLTVQSDRDYFDTVACFIQISPQWGQRLLRAKPNTASENRARANLIGKGGLCVGGASEVWVDPPAFRAYAAEAMYMWLVSAKGVDSLVE